MTWRPRRRQCQRRCQCRCQCQRQPTRSDCGFRRQRRRTRAPFQTPSARDRRRARQTERVRAAQSATPFVFKCVSVIVSGLQFKFGLSDSVWRKWLNGSAGGAAAARLQGTAQNQKSTAPRALPSADRHGCHCGAPRAHPEAAVCRQ